MTDITMERMFNASPDRVFALVTRPENLPLWWGHDGWTLVDHRMDFTRPGPWHSKMRSDEGNPFHISGQVLSVEVPTQVRFTWAWHDASGARGAESEVCFDISPEGTGTRFVLTHTGLSDGDTATSHKGGWTHVLARLERQLS